MAGKSGSNYRCPRGEGMSLFFPRLSRLLGYNNPYVIEPVVLSYNEA